MKKIAIAIVLIVAIIIASLVGWNRYENKEWYRFQHSLKSKHDNIKKISFVSTADSCGIMIYLKETNVEFLTAESIFVDILSELNEEDFLEYLRVKQKKKGGAPIYRISVTFPYQLEHLEYRFQTTQRSKDYEDWYYSKTGYGYTKTYKLSDYKKSD